LNEDSKSRNISSTTTVIPRIGSATIALGYAIEQVAPSFRTRHNDILQRSVSRSERYSRLAHIFPVGSSKIKGKAGNNKLRVLLEENAKSCELVRRFTSYDPLRTKRGGPQDTIKETHAREKIQQQLY